LVIPTSYQLFWVTNKLLTSWLYHDTEPQHVVIEPVSWQLVASFWASLYTWLVKM